MGITWSVSEGLDDWRQQTSGGATKAGGGGGGGGDVDVDCFVHQVRSGKLKFPVNIDEMRGASSQGNQPNAEFSTSAAC
ncbi:3-isopropylmalate dehydratase small subunit [Trichinella spiralis]|uniref:3-isopropylmalate dehydratase small subunit n=1 Tax=Trichinella spiralis TaxID=6334 RepID=A0ABR3KV92_TRISP